MPRIELGRYIQKNLKFDLSAGFLVFLIAIPFCLGIALTSKAPLYSGFISGVIGGIVVGFLSPSAISVSGPAAGMVSIVIMASSYLGSFESCLLALFFSGFLQFFAGSQRLGFFADYFPSSVIKGLITAIGILLIIKQIPLAFTTSHSIPEFNHLLMEASQDSNLHPFTHSNFEINNGACLLSILSLICLFYFEYKPLAWLPGPMLAVIIGTLCNEWFIWHHSYLAQHGPNLVNLPNLNLNNLNQVWQSIPKPKWSDCLKPEVYFFAFIFAIMSSLESLLNITASERIDLRHRLINKNKELKAQGIGNILTGFLGGIPITSVIVRTSLNIESQAKTKMATIFHGVFLLSSFFLISAVLNHIPLCILASILIHTGYKLSQPRRFIDIYKEGHERFIPFISTVLAIIFINLAVGVLIGLIINFIYILKYNSKARIDIIQEVYPAGITNRLLLPQQCTFLNKASLIAELNIIPKNSQLIIDARHAEFIDKEIIEFIQEFKNEQAPQRQISLNLIGFKDHYSIHDHIDFINVSTYNAQSILSPKEVLNILIQGNKRFINEQRIHRSNILDVQFTAETQHPIAVVLGCIDSRVPVETIFDMTFGDLFCVRIAGNVINNDILASIEYACHVIGAKLIVVLGHSRCGAIQAACNHVQEGHITELLDKIKPAIDVEEDTQQGRDGHNAQFIHNVTELNIAHSMLEIYQRSQILKRLIDEEKVGIVGANYNVETATVSFSNYQDRCQAFNLELPHPII